MPQPVSVHPKEAFGDESEAGRNGTSLSFGGSREPIMGRSASLRAIGRPSDAWGEAVPDSDGAGDALCVAQHRWGGEALGAQARPDAESISPTGLARLSSGASRYDSVVRIAHGACATPSVCEDASCSTAHGSSTEETRGPGRSKRIDSARLRTPASPRPLEQSAARTLKPDPRVDKCLVTPRIDAPVHFAGGLTPRLQQRAHPSMAARHRAPSCPSAWPALPARRSWEYPLSTREKWDRVFLIGRREVALLTEQVVCLERIGKRICQRSATARDSASDGTTEEQEPGEIEGVVPSKWRRQRRRCRCQRSGCALCQCRKKLLLNIAVLQSVALREQLRDLERRNLDSQRDAANRAPDREVKKLKGLVIAQKAAITAMQACRAPSPVCSRAALSRTGRGTCA